MTPDPRRPAPESRSAAVSSPAHDEEVIVPDAVPAWVRRLHADGLPTREAIPEALPEAGSQRFVDRWDRVAAGY